MTKKPQDLLEFLRRSSDEDGLDPALPTADRREVERTPRMLVLRQSQVVVAAVAGGLVIFLAFILGLAFGGDGESAPQGAATTGVWVIRVKDYADSRTGRNNAAMVVKQLQEKNLDEVTLQNDGEKGRVVVTLGSWLEEPNLNAAAKQLLTRIRDWPDVEGSLPFAQARFWRIER